jgi:hypothetical protein
MGFLVQGDIETSRDELLDSFYVRIEQFVYARPLNTIGVTVAHYETKEVADLAWPKFVDDGTDMSGQLSVSMSYNGNWEEWPMFFEFDLIENKEIIVDTYEKQWVTSSIEYTDFDENGDPFIDTHLTFEEIDVKNGEEITMKRYLNTEPITNDIFKYAYDHIKEIYTSKCGIDNIKDIL